MRDRGRTGDGARWPAPTGHGRSGCGLDETFPYLQVFTGDTLSAAERRRGLGVEPMTCAAGRVQHAATGLVTLAGGESLTTTWGLVATAAS